MRPIDAVQAIEEALRAGLDPEVDPPRSAIAIGSGQLLLMPAWHARYAGVKVVTVAPGNPERGLPRIQGVYLLIDAETMAVVSTLDAGELTVLRTAAVSAVAVRHLAQPEASRLVLFGTGPQAWGHLLSLAAVRPITEVVVVGRNRNRTASFVERCRAKGFATTVGAPAAVDRADIVACCTTSRTPLFDGHQLSDHATVVAVGSHEPDAREVDGTTIRRSTVVVEARAAALREAGDILMAGARNQIAGNLADLVCGRLTLGPGRPRLFKSVGMAWEDLVVAEKLRAVAG